MSTFPEWSQAEDEDDDEDDNGQDAKRFPSGPVSRLCIGFSILSSIFLFVSTFWQHISSSAGATMAQSLSYGTVQAHVGPKASKGKPFLVQFAAGVILLPQVHFFTRFRFKRVRYAHLTQPHREKLQIKC